MGQYQSPNDSSCFTKNRVYKEKKTYGYKERNEEKRAEFLKIIATKHTDNPVYIDESGIDNTEDYEYGYCKKGERFHALKSGVKRERISMIAALNQRKIIAPLTFEEYCDTELFNAWFEQFLTPILKPGQTVILDNASFHKSKKISELAKGVGAEILYLPPYSPDFNEIEHFWFAIKHAVRKILPIFWPDINAAIDFVFQKSGKPYFGLLYIQKFLCPELRKNEVVVCDNASFHKSVKTKNLIENSDYKLMFLPTYSPDLNPIEHCWHTIKNWLRPRMNQHEDQDLHLLVGQAITEVYHLV